MNVFLVVSHCVPTCFPKISFFHNQRYHKWQSCFIEFFLDKCFKIFFLLHKYIFLSNYFYNISLLSWGLFVSFSFGIVPSFHGECKLLNSTCRPIPNVEISRCFLGNYLKNRFSFSISHYFMWAIYFFLFPNSFLVSQPSFEIFHHWEFILLMIWFNLNLIFRNTWFQILFLLLDCWYVFFSCTS